jgi:FSR family fosmidomycin resistance protein-like MFS transporter
MKCLVPLICLALLHTLVDASALLIEPLWPELQRVFGLAAVAAMSVTFVVQSLPASVSQGVFGYLCDRRTSPRILYVGPIMAIVCLTMIGVAPTPNKVTLYLLLLIGGIGIGAFHPEAAVLAGRLIPGQRTRSLSLFMFGGSLGLALGPLLGGAIVNRWGLPALAYLCPPMVLLVVLLWKFGRLQEHANVPREVSARPGLAGVFEGKLGVALLVLAVCSLRLVPNMAMMKVLSFTLDRQGYDAAGIGLHQTLFLVSASVGMFVLAFRFPKGWEKRFLVLCPLVGIPLLYVLGMPSCPRWLFVATLVPCGLVLWGTTPAMVSYAQQQFPKGVGLASALTLGVSWGIAGLIQAPVTAYFQNIGNPQLAFHAFISALLLSALGASALPSTAPRRAALVIPADA